MLIPKKVKHRKWHKGRSRKRTVETRGLDLNYGQYGLKALEGARLARVIVTHAHSDHVSGVGAIAARWPQVRFCKMPWPERDAGHPVRWETLEDDRQAGMAKKSGLQSGAVEFVAHNPGWPFDGGLGVFFSNQDGFHERVATADLSMNVRHRYKVRRV